MTPNQAADLAKRVEVAATFGADVFQIVEIKEPSENAIGLTIYKIAKETEDGGLEAPLKGAYNDSQLLRIINVEHHPAPPAPYVDSEDDEFPDGYPDESEDDEPLQRRRIDQRELDDLELE